MENINEMFASEEFKEAQRATAEYLFGLESIDDAPQSKITDEFTKTFQEKK